MDIVFTAGPDDLPPTLVFDYPSVEAIAAFVLELLPAPPPTQPPVAAAAPPADAVVLASIMPGEETVVSTTMDSWFQNCSALETAACSVPPTGISVASWDIDYVTL